MKGGDVIRKARRMAGLAQSDLAHDLGTTPSVLSRWENGQVEPSFAAVVRTVEACGLELAAVLSEPDADPHDVSLLETTLAMTVDERLQRLIDYVRFVGAGRAAMRAR
ncbi:MAG: helix-turn-helix domain-containing protein [Luteitalea sp.]|nr:helix-turn-helix domain-containing protein [Luteitalea sp.]